MKLVIPKEKELRDVSYPLIITINFNGFDIDYFLPALFTTILSDGAQFGRKVNDPTDLNVYLERLAAHPSLEGFDSERDIRILRQIVRTDLVSLGRKNKGRSQEQILKIGRAHV